jgi:membrane protease YdiL (CAAX protease family)
VSEPAPSEPRALSQLALLFGLWWRHMRRRASRLGDTPKLSGVPTSLLLNVLTTCYLTIPVWQSVTRSVALDPGLFTWHMLGATTCAFGIGVSKGSGRLQLRGLRNDAFLEPLPLATLARLGLQFADGFLLMPLALTVPLAAAHEYGASGAAAWLGMLLGSVSFVTLFVVGQAASAWARVLGPPATQRYGVYTGIGLNLVGMASVFTPLGQFFGSSRFAQRFARCWLEPDAALAALFALMALSLVSAYFALCAAERRGFDHLELQHQAPKAHRGVRDRAGLEWLMMARQGGYTLLVVFSAVLIGTIALVWRSGRNFPSGALTFSVAFVVYLAALQTIGQAGRAARGDLLARPFLSALPLSPHQVLEGKAGALRRLLIPALVMLALLTAAALLHHEWSQAYRAALSFISLLIVVDGAVSVAFLATGIGVVGVGGGQASSSFSTQLLMMPLLATALASNAWTATTASIAVLAITWESQRAARKSLRWLDDPADDAERETTVWRALLAATGFFAMQALSYRLFSATGLGSGYLTSLTFGSGAILLAMLTTRNNARFERPRFLPKAAIYWPLGALAGAGSGGLALSMAKFLPPPPDAPSPLASSGELLAIALTLTVMAPLVEEYFFRGWLQKAIEYDLPEGKKHWAFVLGAVAFALAHLGTYGVPQLLLGLAAGALYASGGGLWPSILAHAVHNGVVLLVQH